MEPVIPRGRGKHIGGGRERKGIALEWRGGGTVLMGKTNLHQKRGKGKGGHKRNVLSCGARTSDFGGEGHFRRWKHAPGVPLKGTARFFLVTAGSLAAS